MARKRWGKTARERGKILSQVSTKQSITFSKVGFLNFLFLNCVASNFASRHLITILFRLYQALQNSILQRPLNLWIIIKTVLYKEIMPNSC